MTTTDGRETPEEYGQRRANETRSRYMLTGLGQVLAACASNKRLAIRDLEGVARLFHPDRRNAP